MRAYIYVYQKDNQNHKVKIYAKNDKQANDLKSLVSENALMVGARKLTLNELSNINKTADFMAKQKHYLRGLGNGD